MLLADPAIVATIQLAISTAGGIAIAWIGVQQLIAKRKLAEAASKMDRAARHHEDTLANIQNLGTQIDDMQTQLSETNLKLKTPKGNR